MKLRVIDIDNDGAYVCISSELKKYRIDLDEDEIPAIKDGAESILDKIIEVTDLIPYTHLAYEPRIVDE